MYCPNCGEKNPDQATFCGKCGAQIIGVDDLREDMQDVQSSGKMRYVAMIAIPVVVAVAAVSAFLSINRGQSSVANETSRQARQTTNQTKGKSEGSILESLFSGDEDTPLQRMIVFEDEALFCYYDYEYKGDQLLRITAYDPKGNAFLTDEAEYDEFGNETKHIAVPEGVQSDIENIEFGITYHNYEYNDKNQVISDTTSDVNGKEHAYLEFSYDDSGREISRTLYESSYGGDGEWKYLYTITYDENGESEYTYPEGKGAPNQREKMAFDDAGNVTEEIEYDYHGEPAYLRKWSYDSAGAARIHQYAIDSNELKEVIFYYPVNSDKLYFHADKNGFITESSEYHAQGRMEVSDIRRFGPDARLSLSRYVYDEFDREVVRAYYKIDSAGQEIMDYVKIFDYSQNAIVKKVNPDLFGSEYSVAIPEVYQQFRLYTPLFSFFVPETWRGRCLFYAEDDDGSYSLTAYLMEPNDWRWPPEGGFPLFTVYANAEYYFEGEEENNLIGVLHNALGWTWNLKYFVWEDVDVPDSLADEYNRLHKEINTIISSIEPGELTYMETDRGIVSKIPGGGTDFPVAKEITQEEVESKILAYYGTKDVYMPGELDIYQYDTGYYSAQLYDELGGWSATSAWYYISKYGYCRPDFYFEDTKDPDIIYLSDY